MIPFHRSSFWEKQSFLNDIDYLIVGSGIVGLSTAINIKRAKPKSKVVVLERGYLPSGASSKNAGFACIGSSSEILDDLNNTETDTVFNILEKRWKGLIELKSLLGKKAIDFSQEGSYELFKAAEKNEFTQCENKLDWLNSKLYDITEIKEVYQIDNSIIGKSHFDGFKNAISNAAEGQLDTGKMMKSLIEKASALGVIILNGIKVKSIGTKDIETNFGKLNFDKLAICNNGLASKFIEGIDLKAVRAQVVVTSPINNLAFKGIFHFDKGYYYFRNIGNRVLFGGGRNLDFKAEETDELNTSDQIMNHLSEILESKILPNKPFTIEHQWAGTMGIGSNKEPIIKKVDKSIYCGVRLGGMGVAIGSLVGKELSQLITES